MNTRLKRLRISASLTQSELAAAIGVTQPTYQRWEVGTVKIPKTKLQKLSKVLDASADAILGTHPPVDVSIYDDTVSDELSYYGEVAVHFRGGGEPLLLSISEAAFASLHRDLQSDRSFVTVKNLANQTVIIRTKSVSDLYFSSEAYDFFGPEHGSYNNYLDIRLPDSRDWEIIESIAFDEVGIEDFDPKDVERVRSRIMITEDQYQDFVSKGLIEIEDLEKERKKNQDATDRILEAASKTQYQLSTGQQRSVYIDSPINLFNAFCELLEFGDDLPIRNNLRIEAEGRHRIIFINADAIDYIAIPTHQLENGEAEADADTLGL